MDRPPASRGEARRRASVVAGGAWALLALLPASCVTAKEGEAMRAETAAQKARLDALDRRDEEAKEQLARLRSILDEATALLTRNSADLGAKVAKTETDVNVLAGRIEEAQHALAELQRASQETQKKLADERTRLEARLAVIEQTQQAQQKVVERISPAIPEDKEKLWAEAEARLAAAQNEDARKLYRIFIQRVPGDPRAPQALLAIGRSFVAESRFPQAVGEFQKVLDNYGRSPEVPEAMWQIAQTYVELKFCTDARALLQDLAKRYPKSPRAAEVKDRLKEIDRISKDRARCTT